MRFLCRDAEPGCANTAGTQKTQYPMPTSRIPHRDPRTFDPLFKGPLYLSFDLDALDPAFAPGVSHHEPGGLTMREALGIIQRIDVPLIGADIVEYNPRRDVQAMTAAVAAKLVKEIGGRMLSKS